MLSPATKFFPPAGPELSPELSGRAGPEHARRERSRVLGRNVLELVGHDINVGREAVEGLRVGVGAGVTRCTTSKAGELGVGANTRHLKPMRAAANASMRPSCPPPRMPIVAPGARTGARTLTRPHPSAPRRRRPSDAAARHRAGPLVLYRSTPRCLRQAAPRSAPAAPPDRQRPYQRARTARSNTAS